MSLSLVTAAAVAAVPLQTVKDHLRILDNAEDALITGHISAATAWAEDYLNRKLINQTWKLTLDLFPSSREIELPFPPVSSVSHVKYYNTSASLTTLSSSDYWSVLNLTDQPAKIILKSTASWPDLQDDRPQAVEVTFVCGYGAAHTDIPTEIRQAIMILAAHLYTVRSKDETGTIISQHQHSFKEILGPRRFHSLA